MGDGWKGSGERGHGGGWGLDSVYSEDLCRSKAELEEGSPLGVRKKIEKITSLVMRTLIIYYFKFNV